MIDFDVAMDKLCSLDSANDIAEFLRGQGVKGIRISPNSCPIASWVQSTTGLEHVVAVPDSVYAWGAEEGKLTRQVTPMMTDFMHAFDIGRYADLDSEI